jgi:hypothetical protein
MAEETPNPQSEELVDQELLKKVQILTKLTLVRQIKNHRRVKKNYILQMKIVI